MSTITQKGEESNAHPVGKQAKGSKSKQIPKKPRSGNTTIAFNIFAEPSGRSNASSVFNRFTESVIRRGGYLNLNDIYDALSSEIQLQHVPEMRLIQDQNKLINICINSYWFGTSIRIFSELEKFIVNCVNRRFIARNEATVENFAQLGMGSLLRHDRVVELFLLAPAAKELSKPHIHESDLACITSDQIVQLVLKFVEKEGRQMKRIDERRMVEFVKTKSNSRTLLGVMVEWPTVFHNCKAAKFQDLNLIREGKERYVRDLASDLAAALERSKAAISNAPCKQLLTQAERQRKNRRKQHRKWFESLLVQNDQFKACWYRLFIAREDASSAHLPVRAIFDLDGIYVHDKAAAAPSDVDFLDALFEEFYENVCSGSIKASYLSVLLWEQPGQKMRELVSSMISEFLALFLAHNEATARERGASADYSNQALRSPEQSQNQDNRTSAAILVKN